MDQRPADSVSPASDFDDSQYKREKGCLICSQVFGSSALTKHFWYPLLSKVCHHAVCANCSKGTVHDPKTKRQVRACNNCYKESFVKREDHKQLQIEEHTKLLSDLQAEAEREREQNRLLALKLQEAQDTIRKLESATRGENLETMQELQLKLEKKKKKREALQAKLDSNAAELRGTEGRIETTQRTMADVAVQMQEAWEREKGELQALLEALEAKIKGKKDRKGSLIKQVEEEKRLQEELNALKSGLEAKEADFEGKNQAYLSEKAALSTQIETLEAQLESLQLDLAQYQAKCKEHETSVGGLDLLKVTVASLISDSMSFQQKVTHKAAKTNLKLEENADLEDKVAELKWQLELKRQHMQDLALACKAPSDSQDDTQFSDAKEVISSEITNKKAILEGKMEEFNQVKQRLEEIEQTSADLNSKLTALKAEQDQGNSQITDLKASNAQLLSKISSQPIKALSDELQSLQSDLSSQDTVLASLQSRLSDLEQAASRPAAQGKCCALF